MKYFRVINQFDPEETFLITATDRTNALEAALHEIGWKVRASLTPNVKASHE
jgi:hypothetical protein